MISHSNMDAAAVISQYHGIGNMLRSLAILNLVEYKWPKPACVKDCSVFDFIIVGGGTAGCVVANRLIELGNVTVLLIEAGGNPPMETEMAGLYPFLKHTSVDWNFTSIPNKEMMPAHKNYVAEMTQGKMLGGSGSINYMGYERGNRQDYDRWANCTNDDVWSWDSVLPTFLKNEQLIDKRILNSPDKCFYGTDGNIKVMKQYFKRNQDYFKSFEELGWSHHLDINPNHPLGFTDVMYNIADNMRQSTALKFLSPIRNHRNLYVMTHTVATKIIFDCHKRAIGVKVITKNNKKLTFKARYEVIVSAGAIKSPQLLLLSGIGPENHLKEKGIKMIANLPVGLNFQDHVNLHFAYKLKKAVRGTKLKDPHKYPYCLFDGYVALNKSQGYPDYQVIGVSFGKRETFLGLCVYFYSFNTEYCDDLSKDYTEHELLFITLTLLYPKSRGNICLGSTNPHDPPLITPGYYNDPEDIKKHTSYFKDFNRILGTSFFKKVNAELVMPELKNCKRLKHHSEEYADCHTVGMSDTAFYYCCSNGMGRVLDSRLRVMGVKDLRVIDASSFPDTVGTTTQATVIMLAQKGVEFIIQDYLQKSQTKSDKNVESISCIFPLHCH